MPEIKRPLKVCPDYLDGDEAYIIEPDNTWSDVLRHVCDDIGPELLLILADSVASAARLNEET